MRADILVVKKSKTRAFKKHSWTYRFRRITFTFNKKQHDDFQRRSEFPLIKRITQKGSFWYRILWAAALLLCWLLSIFQVWDRVDYYFSEPIWTSVQIIQNNDLYLPSVTGCIDTFSTKEIVRMRDDFASRRGVDPCNYRQTNFYALDELGLYREFNYTRLTQTALLGDELNIDCAAKSDTMGRKVCTITQYVNSMSSCVTTTFNIPARQIIQIMPSLRWNFASDVCQKSSDIKSLAVLVHERIFDIRWILWKFANDEDGVELEHSNGTERVVSLTKTKFSYVSTRRNPCTNDQTYLRCFHKHIDTLVKTSGMQCSFPEYGPPHVNPCQNVSAAIYASFQLNLLMRKEIPCHRRCHQTLYRRIRERRQGHAGQVSVSVNFLDNIEFVSDEAIAYSLVSLFCDIGGSVGLFLGISLISVFEVMEACCHRSIKLILSFKPNK